MIEYRNLRVALLGGGSVGAQVARLLLEQGDELANRVGAGLELIGIAVRDVDAERTVDLPKELFTTDADPALVRLAGKHCESGDIVVDADYLPADVTPGDLVAVAATGAYCWSLASNYNYLGRPPVVAVADGTARLLVRGESIADVLARDTGITPAASVHPASGHPASAHPDSGPVAFDSGPVAFDNKDSRR